MTIREALEAVINEAKGGDAEYAKTYARAGLEIGGSEDAVVVTVGNAIGIAHKKTGQMLDEEAGQEIVLPAQQRQAPVIR